MSSSSCLVGLPLLCLVLLLLISANHLIKTHAFAVAPSRCHPPVVTSHSQTYTLYTTSCLHLFKDLFKSKKDKDGELQIALTEKKKTGDYKLEKISNKQNRDWTKEGRSMNQAAQDEKNKQQRAIEDKQPKSYNWKKANEFPNLYKGWIKADGDQIAKQMISGVKASLAKKENYIEVIFDPVPNLDEVTYGTPNNLKFRKEVNANLKVPDAATKRGGPSTLEWSNIYWTNRLVAGLGKKNAVALSISGEGCNGKQFTPTLSNGLRLVTLNEGKKILTKPGDASLLILISPTAEGQYREAEKLGALLGCSVVAINSAYSYRYDIGAGAPWNLSYVMKRIPKGWIFRIAPNKFDAIIEGPGYEITRSSQFASQPKLTEISKINKEASDKLYGPTGNDRIFENRL